MSTRVDASDPAIQQAINEIKDGSNRWLVLDYVPKSDNKLRLLEKGSGDLSEMLENLNDGKILYFFIWFSINNVKKFAYISWCGEGVTGMKKGLFNNHAQDVSFLFKGFHAQINARNEKDVKEQLIIDRLTKATGAAYDAGSKNQGSANLVPSSVSQGREQATKSNAEVRTFEKSKGSDQSTENTPLPSSITYESRKLDQTTESRPAPSAVRYDQAKLDQTTESRPAPSAIRYEPAKLDQTTENKPSQSSLPGTRNPSNTPAVKGSATGIKSRFEQQAQSTPSPVGPPKPAPGKIGVKASIPPPQQQSIQAPPPARPPPAAKPVPVPEPEPEPVQETYYEPEPEPEPVQETYYEPEPEPAQESYNEPEQEANYEEPAQETYEQPAEEYSEAQGYEGEGGDASNYGVVVAKALYDYDAENPDDLSFKEGELINVLDQNDPSGWWQGELNGKTGFFPSNFVELQ